LFFGGYGYLGRPLSEGLMRQGYRVYAVGKSKAFDINENSYIEIDGIENLIFKIKPDVIIYGVKSQFQCDVNKCMSFFNIIKMSLGESGNNVYIVNLGSCAEYGFLDDSVDFFYETDTLNPTTDYGIEKKNVSDTLWKFFKNENILDLKIFNVYDRTPQFGFFPYYLNVVSKNIDLTEVKIKDPYSVRDYISRDALVTILLRLIQARLTGRVNVCSGIGRTNLEFAQFYLDAIDREVKLVPCIDTAKETRTRSVGSVTKLRMLLGELHDTDRH